MECFKPQYKKAQLSLSLIDKPTGLISQIREEMGINISKHIEISSLSKSNLSQEVEAFFLEDHITRLCPDKDKCVLDPAIVLKLCN